MKPLITIRLNAGEPPVYLHAKQLRRCMIMLLHRLLVIIPFFICAYVSLGETRPVSYRHNVQNGLLSNEVYAIATDSSGHIWMATARGIVRFDGKNHVYYTTENGLTDNFIIKFFLSPHKRLWAFGADRTLYYLNNQFRFVPYRHAGKLTNILNKIHYNELCGIYFEQEEPCYFSTNQQGILQVIHDSISEIWPHKKGPVIMPRYGLLGYTTSQASGTGPFAPSKLSHTNPVKRPNCLIRKNKDVLLTIDNTLIVIRQQQVIYQTQFKGLILSVYEDAKEQLWISFYNGGIRKYLAHEAIQEKAGTFDFPHEKITGICEDFEGGYWFSTYSNGVIYVPGFHQQEVVIPPADGLNSSGIRVVTDDNKNLFAVTVEKELLQINASGVVNKTVITSKAQNSVCNEITYHAPSRNLYLCFSHGIYTANAKLQLSKDVIQGARGVIFSADHKHLYSFGGHTAYKIRIQDNQVIEKAYVSDAVTALYEDNTGTVWVGTEKGMAVFKANRVTPILRERINSRIARIKPLNTQQLVLATIGNGIYILGPGQTIVNIRTGNSAMQNMVNDVSIQHDTIWAATGDGIVAVTYHGNNSYRVQPLDNSFKEIKTIRFLNNFGYYLADNRLVLTKGKPGSASAPPPKIIADSITTSGQLIQHTTLSDLPYFTSNLTFHFHAITFRQAQHSFYQYRLMGIDTNWVKLSHNELTFETLPPGQYVLEVAAVTNNSQLPSNLLMIPFNIKPPFWMHWAFIITLLLVASGILFGIISILYKRRLKIYQEKEHYMRMEQQALSAQINPHFLFNALNSIQHMVLKETGIQAIKHLGQFSQMMRLSIEHARQKWVPVKDECKLLKTYLELEQLRFKDKFDVDIETSAEALMQHLMIPGMLIQPFVENAILHGISHLTQRKGIIVIRLNLKSGYLKCEVEDNGVGRQQAALHKSKYSNLHRSYGVKITCERLQILCAQLKQPYFYQVTDKLNDQQQVLGTKVNFHIPFKLNHEIDSNSY